MSIITMGYGQIVEGLYPSEEINITLSTAATADDTPYDIAMHQGDVKLLTFTVTDENDEAVDCTGSTLLMILNNYRRNDRLEILTDSFNITDEASGIYRYTLDTSTYYKGTYEGTLTIDFGSSTETSNTFFLRIL
jgi:hypothetical protein